MNSRNSLFFSLMLAILCVSCSPITSLKQGYYSSKSPLPFEKIDCILPDSIFYSTDDYDLIRCEGVPNNFWFIPNRLVVETDINAQPLVYSQYLKKNYINIIVKFTYQKEKFIEASSYLKSLDNANNLFLLSINSVRITPFTGLPSQSIEITGTTEYAYFGGYVTFQIKGLRLINEMRSLFLSSSGFLMNYEFKYLIHKTDHLLQKSLTKTIYIKNINF